MKTLLVGYKAADLSAEMLGEDVVCHVLDIYHQHAIEKVFPGAHVICSAHLPVEDWAQIRFRTGPKLMSGELSLDLLQECYALLLRNEPNANPQSIIKNRQRFLLDYVGRERDRNDLLDRLRDFPRRQRNFRAQWPASVPGGRKLEFASYPGCFCHRRLDEGGLALAEVAVRELANAEPKPRKVLDMGCGCGLVGLLIADSVAEIALTMVDSHTRAVEAAVENAERFGIAAETVLSDNGTDAATDGTFDIFVGNPPYYSDYRIADVFLETAHRALKPGGICYMVCKNAAGLEPVQRRVFPEVEIINRRGYCVLKSIYGTA